MICPIFATSREEQRLFYKLFTSTFPNFFVEEIVADPSSKASHRGAQEAAQEIGRRSRIGASAAIVVLVLVGLIVLSKHGREPAASNPAPTIVATPGIESAPIIRQLQQPTKRTDTGYRAVVFLSPLAAWVGAEIWALTRRRLLVEKTSYVQPDAPPVRLPSFLREGISDKTVARLTRKLRQPILGPERFDVRATIENTCRAAGFPQIFYSRTQRRPHYLVLIDRLSPSDAEGKFFEDLVEELQRRGLRISTYTFSGDPRVCRSSKTKDNIFLADLLQATGDHRLILFGQGDNLFTEWGEATAAGQVLLRWKNRAVVTPRRPEQWGPRETNLAREFLTLPATTAAILSALNYRRSGDTDGVRMTRVGLEPHVSTWDHATRDEIRKYCSDHELFTLICACALYPQLRWDLTLHLAAVVAPGLLKGSNLEKILGIPWFRIGAIPPHLRPTLTESLETKKQLRFRYAIEQFLDQPLPWATRVAPSKPAVDLAVYGLDLTLDDRRPIERDEAFARMFKLVVVPLLCGTLFVEGRSAMGVRLAARLTIGLYVAVCVGLLVWVRN